MEKARETESPALGAEPVPEQGHCARPHTADVVIEAWAPTAAGCFEEAVGAFVEVFADTDGVAVHRAIGFDVGPGPLPDLLVLLLEEALVTVEARAAVPVGVEVEVAGDRLVGRFTVVPAGLVQLIGPIPKGVSYSGLSFGPDGEGWRCRATVDV